MEGGPGLLLVTAPCSRICTLCSANTNSFDLIFCYDLERGPNGEPVPPRMVLPSTGTQPWWRGQ